MLRSSYAALEDEARKGRAVLIIAMLLHMTASVISIAAINRNPVSAIIPMLIQVGLCAALFAGKNWARWILMILNLVATTVMLYLIFGGQIHATGFYLARAAICGVVLVLLLLPWSKSYIIWKNLRF